MIKQDYNEAFKEVNRANWATLVFLHLSSLGLNRPDIIVTYIIIKMIRKRDEKTQLLNDQLVQASKLASIGEVSAKVAHELNSPLGGILIYANLLLEDIRRRIPSRMILKKSLIRPCAVKRSSRTYWNSADSPTIAGSLAASISRSGRLSTF